ncbi:MAG: hypothetical protein ACKORC_03620 [Acidimicrobiia bacterium]
MSTLILIIVGAAWLGVLAPPIVRARMHRSPSTSVGAFRRQLTSLQGRDPRRPQGQLRAMARPLVQDRAHRVHVPSLSGITGPILRPTGTRAHAPRTGDWYARELQRQRRQHTVVGLAIATAVFLFLAFTTGSLALVYCFVLSLIALVAYCYWLVQLRVRRDNDRYVHRVRGRAA